MYTKYWMKIRTIIREQHAEPSLDVMRLLEMMKWKLRLGG